MITRQLCKQIKDYGIERMSRETGLSRSNIYGIIKHEITPRIDTYQCLLEALGYELKITKRIKDKKDKNYIDQLKANLSDYGAPINTSTKNYKSMTLDETFIEALEYGRTDTSINVSLPYFIHKNFDQLEIMNTIQITNEPLYLGYLLNLIALLTNNIKTISYMSILESMHTVPKKQPLIKNQTIGKFQKKALKETDNACAAKWGFETLDSMSNIKSRFDKWNEAQL